MFSGVVFKVWYVIFCVLSSLLEVYMHTCTHLHDVTTVQV